MSDLAAARQLYASGDFDACHAAVRAILRADPTDWKAATVLGDVLARLGRRVEAVEILKQLMPLADQIPKVRESLAIALVNTGEPDAAIELFEQELAKTGRRETFIQYLYVLGYAPTTTMRKLMRQNQAFHRQNLATRGIVPFDHRPGPTDTPDKRLRIGYISCHFNWFQYMGFVHPILRAHDPAQVQPVCLSLHPADLFSHVYDGRVEVHRLTDPDRAATAAAIRDLDIDILVDLIGLDIAGLFEVVVRKPGKIQLVWQNAVGTTGCPAIDYTLGDDLLTPQRHEPWYTEEILRVPTVNVAYHPYVPLPAIVPPPCLETGHVTFGSLSLMHKVNRPCIWLWSKVLQAVPNSRFVLRNSQLKDPKLRAKLLGWFVDEGVAAERVTLGETPLGIGYLRHYHEIDIALGTIPVNGGTTVTEALCVGVPVLSLDWDTCLGLTGREILTAVGLDNWACAGAAEFVARAAALAADRKGLARFRATSRTRILSEGLFDTATLVREAEAVFRRIWQRWLQSHA